MKSARSGIGDAMDCVICSCTESYGILTGFHRSTLKFAHDQTARIYCGSWRRSGVACGGGRAQQAKTPVIGVLATFPPEAAKGIVANFRSGLRDAGYVEGEDVVIEFR